MKPILRFLGQGSDAELLGRIAQYAIVVFVVLIAVDHLDIGGDLVQHTFLILLGGVVLALANHDGHLKPGMPADAWIRWQPELEWPAHLVVPR